MSEVGGIGVVVIVPRVISFVERDSICVKGSERLSREALCEDSIKSRKNVCSLHHIIAGLAHTTVFNVALEYVKMPSMRFSIFQKKVTHKSKPKELGKAGDGKTTGEQDAPDLGQGFEIHIAHSFCIINSARYTQYPSSHCNNHHGYYQVGRQRSKQIKHLFE